MPGLDYSQVSNNWKKLQAQLKSERKPEAQSNGLKRRRQEEQQRPISQIKKFKPDYAPVVKPQRSRKMGLEQSKPTANGHQVSNHETLVKQHGISASDVSAAYNSTAGNSIKRSDDDINGGIHPTHKVGKYIAVDCEMVGTGPPPHDDNVLARVSLVNYHGEQIYDSYVLPPSGVVVEDFRTHVSGIKPSHLTRDCARPFVEVQADVAKLLDDRMLVGHSVQNDLRVLLLSHPKRDLRDTSRHAKFREASMGRTPALRDLVKRELGLSIQTGEHSSIEDARAAMLLFRKEKQGFEEENRKKFGVRRVVKGQKGEAKVHSATAVEGDDADSPDASDDEDDSELLDGEDDELALDGEEDGGLGAAGKPKPKRRRKKKKRTKRH
ncbi:hypothetical protein BAUCODRAFT_38799 [Baudoinia panamericana UAMH 10762]|uniref:RNA exonuclease 4 n=1 Tax=Baudoinia panamericana (strain UAMH 10762) TaxID=717646 RepID=M2MYG0_BAUPA|nr:uncharacterized protein BAUCODRAFT_38799 [Baudoinia panamericana UAMH 10762]EMC91689.1 hypothetical protein BAUCODRAFT_38799 [Baudoinia panamericana UAMH 10762]